MFLCSYDDDTINNCNYNVITLKITTIMIMIMVIIMIVIIILLLLPILSRLDPATAEAELTDYVEDVVGATPTNCTKLKSKFDTYSSFILVVPVDVKDRVLDGSKWMFGTLIKPFVHQPRKQTQNNQSLGNVL